MQVSLELNSPTTRIAIQLTTQDYYFVGWTPRYLVDDLLKAAAQYPELHAHVVRNNELGTPLNRRVLIELSGKFPAQYEPMSGEQFQTIH